ncbi:YnbE family lipoprotein [Inquilinus sp. NPDC058860]|uniref:YnbE family lipoprotein n=1 Tax=unclassified Inquilinus TaxID=2645927 RepID=UPI001CE3D825|nr:YnbE family lipoprotein [Inquilinus sp. Marseille-Q2685]
MTDRSRAACAGLSLAALLGACSPVIRVEAPDKPIEINLNVRVEQDVKVQVDRELQKVVGKNPAAP